MFCNAIKWNKRYRQRVRPIVEDVLAMLNTHGNTAVLPGLDWENAVSCLLVVIERGLRSNLLHDWRHVNNSSPKLHVNFKIESLVILGWSSDFVIGSEYQICKRRDESHFIWRNWGRCNFDDDYSTTEKYGSMVNIQIWKTNEIRWPEKEMITKRMTERWNVKT